ncbi:hypothetical protein ZIOFF_039392 [Zingiber officinale]|uniref:Uncharacterized protein n=1 Tax=Zingiber officinale TaxID=94328 RepID=A0A8J5L053_ZINOF|nr:hypothetical protein ZIOFF_039392 [Zingiber officinale]
MMIDGRVIRPGPQATAADVLRDHPGYSLLEAGGDQRPLHFSHPLEPGKLYFLLELPRPPMFRRELRRGAVERLESLKLSRLWRMDASAIERRSKVRDDSARVRAGGGGMDDFLVRIRLPKAQVAKLVAESEDKAEVAEKIVALYLAEKVEPATTSMSSPAVARKEVSLLIFGSHHITYR